jgi:hypothetical protein
METFCTDRLGAERLRAEHFGELCQNHRDPGLWRSLRLRARLMVASFPTSSRGGFSAKPGDHWDRGSGLDLSYL